jgi:hypothetical protein
VVILLSGSAVVGTQPATIVQTSAMPAAGNAVGSVCEHGVVLVLLRERVWCTQMPPQPAITSGSCTAQQLSVDTAYWSASLWHVVNTTQGGAQRCWDPGTRQLRAA